jgi:hypothetical protein
MAPAYDGEKDPAVWLTCMEHLGDYGQLTEEQRIWYAAFHLTSRASRWSKQTTEEMPITTWASFTNAIIRNFGSNRNTKIAMTPGNISLEIQYQQCHRHNHKEAPKSIGATMTKAPRSPSGTWMPPKGYTSLADLKARREQQRATMTMSPQLQQQLQDSHLEHPKESGVLSA